MCLDAWDGATTSSVWQSCQSLSPVASHPRVYCFHRSDTYWTCLNAAELTAALLVPLAGELSEVFELTRIEAANPKQTRP